MFEQTALSGQHLWLAILLLVATFVISPMISLIVLIRLPADYFAAANAHGVPDGHGTLFWAGIILKNLLGAILVVVGVILSVPGLPGQGLLTVLAGLLLLDFPHKRILVSKILNRPPVVRTINRLRTKFSRPPLIIG